LAMRMLGHEPDTHVTSHHVMCRESDVTGKVESFFYVRGSIR